MSKTDHAVKQGVGHSGIFILRYQAISPISVCTSEFVQHCSLTDLRLFESECLAN